MLKMKIKLILTLLITSAVLLYTMNSVKAEENEQYVESPFFINISVDIPVIGISAAVASSILLLEDYLPKGHDSNLDRGGVNLMDRSVIGINYPGWGTMGDIGTIVIPVAALCMSLVELADYGWNGVLEDFIIIGETIAVSAMLNQIVAGALPRPRPYMYDASSRNEKAKNTAWDWRSFYSGHTGTSFAASTAFSYLFTVRHPDSPWVPVVWTVSMVSSSLVAISRPLSGEHFWSDVMIGAAIGFAWGILIPGLHQGNRERRAGDLQVIVAPQTIGLTCYF